MAAGLGFKDFTTGEVLTAADVDGYLMQGVWVFASAAARDAAVTSPQEGNFAYLKDTNVTTYYTGSAWANLDTTGMTNPMSTTGDIIYSSSGSTPAKLGIGSTGNVLTVSAGGVPAWAAPASGSTFSGCSLYMSANLTVANITLTTVNFDSEDFDVDGYHSTSSNTSRITIPSGKTGYFSISTSAVWDAGNNYYLESWLYKNGSLFSMVGGDDAGIYKNVLANTKIVYAVPTDYFELKVKQQNGGDRDLLGGTDDTFFSITYLGA